MKKLILMFLVLAATMSCTSAFAAIWYLRIPATEAVSFMERLDVLKGPSPYTLHYTAPIDPTVSGSTTDVLLPIDERAQSVLSAEEWASKLTEMPVEFTHPLPIGH